MVLEQEETSETNCAICFFGLPRSFEMLVLPSVVKNILIPNFRYGCDVFLHYYDIQEESRGRASNGGTIDPIAVYKLKERVAELYGEMDGMAKIPDVSFVVDSDESFWEARGKTVEKYRNEKGPDGNLKYFPWKDSSYQWPISTDNIVKQWHSIQAVWGAMDKHAALHKMNYTRVAMVRSDVIYVKPIDIYETSKKDFDTKNKVAVIPKFATHPVNDRMIYGPYEAVKVWATERFSRLEEHVQSVKPGYGMHSERFMAASIIPGIEGNGFKVEQSPHICFFRARADGQVFLRDCNDNSRFESVSLPRRMRWVEAITGANCSGIPGKIRLLYSRVNCQSVTGELLAVKT
jgi:hypothetical protein